MIDLNRAILDRVLPAAAGSSDWEDVLGRSRAHEKRRRLITLAVVALTAVVAAASSLAVRAIIFDGGGVTALPPLGTKSSTPATGRIVLQFRVPTVQVWVYADGRIIRRTWDGAAGVGGIRTGFIERRLTGEGVALLRAKVRLTGLVERDHVFRHWTLDLFGSLRVWNGTRWVTVEWGRGSPSLSGKPASAPTDKQGEALGRLIDWILDPASVLPTRAWESREPRGYVPSRYAICFTHARAPFGAPTLPPARAMRSLPEAARSLLVGRTRAFSSSGFRTRCSELTIEDARALYGILSKSGYEPDPFATGKTPFAAGPPPGPDNVVNNIRFRAPRPNRTLFIAFEPILPHGQWELMPG